MRLEELRAGRALPRRYRNRRIGEFLKELDMTEGRSTGIPKILHAMDANGSPPPAFDFDEDHTYFMCRLPVHPQATMPEGLTLEVTPEVTPEMRRMLAIIGGEMTRGEIQHALGLRDEKHFREAYQQTAIRSGLIEMTIPDKPRSSKQKYRLSEKGHRFLAREMGAESGASSRARERKG